MYMYMNAKQSNLWSGWEQLVKICELRVDLIILRELSSNYYFKGAQFKCTIFKRVGSLVWKCVNQISISVCFQSCQLSFPCLSPYEALGSLTYSYTFSFNQNILMILQTGKPGSLKSNTACILVLHGNLVAIMKFSHVIESV